MNIGGESIDMYMALAISAQKSGQFADAARIYQDLLHQHPEHQEAWNNLGRVLYQLKRYSEALHAYQEALGLSPESVQTIRNLAELCEAMGRIDNALDCRNKLVELEPNAENKYLLGNLLLRRGNVEGAIVQFQEALALNPGHDDARANLGSALLLARRYDAARMCLEAVLYNVPTHAAAHNSMGLLCRNEGKLDGCIDSFNRAVELRPTSHFYLNNLAGALVQAGRMNEALQAYEKAISLSGNPIIHDDMLFNLHFDPRVDARTIGLRHREWDRLYAAPVRSMQKPLTNDRNPNRRIRVGYVSPDFRDHCASFFSLPLLANHNHKAFEIFCYSSAAPADAFTRRHKSFADQWRESAGWSNPQLAEQIRADHIDILVDLSMHMSGSRLQLFAMKPAPVQVCWLAYPGTTGISEMDYRMTDPYLDPQGMFEGAYSEKSYRLPNSFWCYDPLAKEPEVNALPALGTGQVTFGCLNKFCKVNAGVLELWAQVLRAVPESRMIILSPEGRHREAALGVLVRNGVNAERIRFIVKQPRRQYLETYRQIDICLDTLPYNGHTTSLDSLWMGVPVVTLVGKTVVGRAGLSQLTNLGLTELVATTPAQYVKIAAELAGNLQKLANLRVTLRQRMRESPLMDAPRFARDMEAAFAFMWRNYCNTVGRSG